MIYSNQPRCSVDTRDNLQPLLSSRVAGGNCYQPAEAWSRSPHNLPFSSVRWNLLVWVILLEHGEAVSSLLLGARQHVLVPHYKGNLISLGAVQNIGPSLLWKLHLPGKIVPSVRTPTQFQSLYCLKRERGRRDKGTDPGDFKGLRNVNIWRVQWTGQTGSRKTVLQKNKIKSWNACFSFWNLFYSLFQIEFVGVSVRTNYWSLTASKPLLRSVIAGLLFLQTGLCLQNTVSVSFTEVRRSYIYFFCSFKVKWLRIVLPRK